MKVFINAFWDGFLDKTNSTHIDFFLCLLTNVFNCSIIYSPNMDECDILLESIFGSSVLFNYKKWKYSFLFSGESRLVHWYKQYSCVLWGERNYDNIVNLPLFIPYLYCNGLDVSVGNSSIPPKNVCAIVSNGSGRERNLFMDKLEKIVPIDYAGSYKTNIPIIQEPYFTEGFRKAISQYKFIITMENSREDTYITEKITHGFVSGIIPIYWGSQRIGDYFNKDRFIYVDNVDDETVSMVANRIKYLCLHSDEYLKMVNYPVFSNVRTIDMIARDIRNLIFLKPLPNITQIYFICNPEFEPARCERLSNLFYNKLGFSSDNISFISPTYKHMITDERISQLVTQPIIQRMRHLPMKKAEISLFLNYKAALETIERNYKDGMFLIFESDIFLIDENYSKLCDFLSFIQLKRNDWDVISMGYSEISDTMGSPYMLSISPYRDELSLHNMNFIEDLTNMNDRFRLFRKYHTRCMDSFVWNYNGILKFLNFMNTEPYNSPFDYYMIQKLEIDPNFKHYWSLDSFFIQGSNYGLESSTIQNNTT